MKLEFEMSAAELAGLVPGRTPFSDMNITSDVAGFPLSTLRVEVKDPRLESFFHLLQFMRILIRELVNTGELIRLKSINTEFSMPLLVGTAEWVLPFKKTFRDGAVLL